MHLTAVTSTNNPFVSATNFKKISYTLKFV